MNVEKSEEPVEPAEHPEDECRPCQTHTAKEEQDLARLGPVRLQGQCEGRSMRGCAHVVGTGLVPPGPVRSLCLSTSLGSTWQWVGLTGTRVAGEQGQTYPRVCSNSAVQSMGRKGPSWVLLRDLCPLGGKSCFISYLDCSPIHPSIHQPQNCLRILLSTKLGCFGQNFV